MHRMHLNLTVGSAGNISTESPKEHRYEYTSSNQRLLQSLVFGVIQVVGFTGNLLVVISVVKERRLRTNYYLTVLQLSICDIGLLICSVIEQQVLPWILFSGYFGEARNYELVCEIWLSAVGWFYTNGVFFMVLIGYLRYRSVTKPFEARISRKRTLFIFVLVYTSTIPLLAPRFFSLAEKHGLCYESYLGIFLYDLYTYSLPVFQFLLPMVFLCCLYGKLCISLRKHSKNMQTCEEQDQSQRPGLTTSRLAFALQKRNAKAVITGIIIVAIFGITNIPVQVNSQIVSFEREYAVKHGFLFPHALFLVGSACLNPFIYALLDDAISVSFKRRIKNIWCCRASRA